MLRSAQILLFGVLLAGSGGDSNGSPQAAQRPYRIDDSFEYEQIGSRFEFSPDGQSIAFIRQRPDKTLPPIGLLNRKLLLSDVWVQDAPGRPAINITNGLQDHSGWWAPQWAPDGRRLAMLSSRGGMVCVWVWEKATRKLTLLSPKGVDYLTLSRTGDGRDVVQWVDNRRLLCMLPPDGRPSKPWSGEGMMIQRANVVWDSASRGELTVSVVDSREFRYEERPVALIDISGAMRAIGTVTPGNSFSEVWWIAPGARWVALLRPGPYAYGTKVASRMGLPRDIELRDMEGKVARLERPLPKNVLTRTVRWSPDGNEVAFFAYGDTPINPLVLFGSAAVEVMPDATSISLENPARLWRVTLSTGTVSQIDTGEIFLGYLGAPSFQWARSGELLVRAPRRTHEMAVFNTLPRQGNRIGPTQPSEWWIIARDGGSRLLSKGPVPESLYPVEGGAAFVGLRGGDVWRFDPTTGAVSNLTDRLAPSVSYLHAPDPAASTLTQLVVTTKLPEGYGATLLRLGHVVAHQESLLDLASQSLTSLAQPLPTAGLATFNVMSSSAIFVAKDRNGTFVWRDRGQAGRDTLVETNTFLRQCANRNVKLIDFVGANGEQLKAALFLPDDYQAGRRYPTVVRVYAGIPSNDFLTHFWSDPSANQPVGNMPIPADVFPAAGYALLQPVLPTNLPGLANEEGVFSITTPVSAVLPAVQRVVDLGFADANRVFLEGASRGGWTVLSILAHTTRFRAASADAGLYGGTQLFWGALPRNFESRYDPNPHDMAMPTARDYWPTDVPWWRDGDRIRRNSPFSYVDRVQTPLLITHSDLDPAVDFGESEDLFRALSAMRKPAQFVRYWGEGHGLQTPANIRDWFQRKLAWFDRYGDIARTVEGKMIFEGEHVESRGGRAALEPKDFARFDVFLPVDAPFPTSSKNSQ